VSTLIYSVVLPAHNEEDLLETSVLEILKGLRDRGDAFEVLVVENGSTDATVAVAERLEREHPEVRLLRLAGADYGRAIAAGLLAAAGDVIVHFDVDYYDLGFLDEASALIRSGRAGIVLASKRAPGARDRRPIARRVLTAGFTTAMRLVLQMPVTDSHGMKVLSRAACQDLARTCTMTGSLFDVELVLRASRTGVAITELPADVSELRPPRTPVIPRAIESGAGLIRLRVLLWREARQPNR
jgi:glycosyltransferase involved in cell wall biosynthesis